MKVVDRIISIIASLLLIAISAVCVLLAVGVISASDIKNNLLSFNQVNWVIGLILLFCAIILFFAAVKVLFVRTGKKKIPAYTIHKGDDGEIAISVTAIDNTVKLAMANFEDIKEVKTHIGISENGITVSARVSIPTGVVIPELLQNVKTYVKTFTEQHTGVDVRQVKLVATEYKNVDPASERKKIAAARQREEKMNTKAKPEDAYASTHAKIVLNNTQQEKIDYNDEPADNEEIFVPKAPVNTASEEVNSEPAKDNETGNAES